MVTLRDLLSTIGYALLLAMPSILCGAEAGASRIAGADAQAFAAHIRPFLDAHCVECHGPDVAKGGLRLDTLAEDFSTPQQTRIWTKVLDRLDAGEMPPKKSARPPVQAQREVLGWITSQLLLAEKHGSNEPPFRLRRMTRLQYENTMHDLLDINIELKNRLPEDSRAFGFDNVGESLTLSPAQIEAYLEAADAALDAAIVHKARPQTTKKRYMGRDALGYGSGKTTGQVLDLGDAAVGFGRMSFVFPDGPEGAFSAPTEGVYRVRASLFAYQSHGEPIEIYVKTGPPIADHPVGYFSVPADTPKVFEFMCRMDRYDTITVSMPWLPYASRGHNPEKMKVPGLGVQYIEVEGPLIEQWPPRSHQTLFGDLPLRSKEKSGPRSLMLRVECDQPHEQSQRLLTAFMRRAFRRPVATSEVQPFVELVAHELEDSHDFEDAMRAGYKAILCSPDFLFFQEKRGEANAFALASRLSYFLWNTMPDETLLTLAEHGELSRPQVLHEQVERLLNDPKSQAFVQNFVSQWLDLRLIDFTTPDKKLYPEYDLSRDALLRKSIVEETEMFFSDVLKKDLSVANFVDSDFTFLNDRLAQHYGIKGVKGPEMRRVTLPPACHRGGVLTQASVLKVTANGTTTSPVVRGVWVLRNLLGKVPDPPPPNAGAIEPDVRGAKTIREQLEKHRRVPSCAGCHVKIDPLGFALENYDVLGGWQDQYRVLRGANLKLAKDGPKVENDSGLSLPDGTTITSIEQLKQYLLSDKDRLAKCLAEKLLVYSTGRGLKFSDREAVKQIVSHVREKNYGLRALVHEVVQSPEFMSQ